MTRTARVPWKRPNPRKRAGKATTHLSPAKKAAAKQRARRAGRRYPNLVDNMRMAAKTGKATKKAGQKKAAGKPAKKPTAKKPTAKKPAVRRRALPDAKRAPRKRSRSVAEKDPRGGLSAAGRKAFARRDGSHLRPGVAKKASEMTPDDMRRKGSWAVRFYGRAKLPPLVDAKGNPTRHALSAHAWGEPVPKTVAAARRIAAKGERLLARYRRSKAHS
jgi:hypothetical protein